MQLSLNVIWLNCPPIIQQVRIHILHKLLLMNGMPGRDPADWQDYVDNE